MNDRTLSAVWKELEEQLYQKMTDAALAGRLTGYAYKIPVLYGGYHFEYMDVSAPIPEALLEVSRKAKEAREKFEADLRADLAQPGRV